MKNSIDYLPNKKKEDLNRLVQLIRKHLPKVQMIILFGSTARNEYVDFDERFEFGVHTIYRSDYDILLVTYKQRSFTVEKAIDKIEKDYEQCAITPTPVQIIHDSIFKVNSDLSEGRYFYVEIQREGVMLYDSGKFQLVQPRKLRYDEIRKQAEEYYEGKFSRSTGFLRSARHDIEDGDLQLAAFHLHQACENAYISIRLTYTLYSGKLHDLKKYIKLVRRYSPELDKVFPCDTEEEKRLFQLIRAAYVEGRYNPKFLVTQADIDALIPKVELLREITQRICHERIAYYARAAQEEPEEGNADDTETPIS